MESNRSIMFTGIWDGGRGYCALPPPPPKKKKKKNMKSNAIISAKLGQNLGEFWREKNLVEFRQRFRQDLFFSSSFFLLVKIFCWVRTCRISWSHDTEIEEHNILDTQGREDCTSPSCAKFSGLAEFQAWICDSGKTGQKCVCPPKNEKVPYLLTMLKLFHKSPKWHFQCIISGENINNLF